MTIDVPILGYSCEKSQVIRILQSVVYTIVESLDQFAHSIFV